MNKGLDEVLYSVTVADLVYILKALLDDADCYLSGPEAWERLTLEERAEICLKAAEHPLMPDQWPVACEEAVLEVIPDLRRRFGNEQSSVDIWGDDLDLVTSTQ